MSDLELLSQSIQKILTFEGPSDEHKQGELNLKNAKVANINQYYRLLLQLLKSS